MDELLALALDEPDAAEHEARARLARHDLSVAGRSIAHQALGLVHRGRVELEPALRELRRAVRYAEHADDARQADARATHGATLVVAGRADTGLRELARAVDLAPDDPLVRMRRGVVLVFLGRHDDSRADLLSAVEGFRASGDGPWEARALHNLGYTELAMGRLDEAEAHTGAALALLRGAGQEVEALWAEQNLGEIRLCRGDLPGALDTFDRVAAGYAALDHRRAWIDLLRCRAYLTAGLSAEAADVGLGALRGRLLDVERNALLLTTATALLDAGRVREAVDLAREARDLSRRVHDEWFELRSRVVLVRARRRLGEGRRWAKESVMVADAAHRQRADDAPLALVLAAEQVTATERADLLGTAGGYRRSGPPLTRAAGWWAVGLAAADVGRDAAVRRACAGGFDALDEHRQSLGSTELRALATGHGSELAALALRHAAHDPRALLGWSERWRASSLAQPPVTPGNDPVLPSLVALRDNGRRLAEARAEGEATEQLERERARLERAVRAEHHHQAGRGGGATQRFDVRRLVEEVGGGCLVELVDVDGVLHVLVVHDGRVRRRIAGTTQAALALTQSAAFVLRRAARGRPYAPGDLGQRLQDELLGDAARLVPDGPVTVVPTGRLHGVPWALLPALERRAFGIVPSAAQWLRARAVTEPTTGTVLLSGPDLGTGGAEVAVLAGRHPDATVLTGGDATVEAAMAALDGAHLAHVAAHGHFRADSPLFSSLEMADGPLTVYDLERLAVAPYRMVLSACESGVLAPVGADELLGLASALFALGTAGLVCSVADVNDEATAELMVDLHTHLDAGADPAGALLAVREARPADPTAASFVALGV